MRTLAILPCIAACASSPTTPEPSFSSVRERLTAEPTRLFIPADTNAGVFAARRWSPDAWIDAVWPVAVTSGELVARLADDKLVIDAFDFNVGTIDLPATITATPLQLRDVRIQLASAPTTDVAWSDDDDATAHVPVSLTLSWSLESNGTITPLGKQQLAPIAMDIALAGTGDQVYTALDLHAAGTLWSWADLLELTKLDLTLVAAWNE